MSTRHVVGAERVEGDPYDENGHRPVGVWHAVDADTHVVACGHPILEVFDGITWEAKRTTVLCQACLRSIAGWG